VKGSSNRYKKKLPIILEKLKSNIPKLSCAAHTASWDTCAPRVGHHCVELIQVGWYSYVTVYTKNWRPTASELRDFSRQFEPRHQVTRTTATGAFSFEIQRNDNSLSAYYVWSTRILSD